MRQNQEPPPGSDPRQPFYGNRLPAAAGSLRELEQTGRAHAHNIAIKSASPIHHRLSSTQAPSNPIEHNRLMSSQPTARNTNAHSGDVNHIAFSQPIPDSTTTTSGGVATITTQTTKSNASPSEHCMAPPTVSRTPPVLPILGNGTGPRVVVTRMPNSNGLSRPGTLIRTLQTASSLSTNTSANNPIRSTMTVYIPTFNGKTRPVEAEFATHPKTGARMVVFHLPTSNSPSWPGTPTTTMATPIIGNSQFNPVRVTATTTYGSPTLVDSGSATVSGSTATAGPSTPTVTLGSSIMSIQKGPPIKTLKTRDYRDRLEVGAAQLHGNPVNADEPSLVTHDDISVNKMPPTRPKPATFINSTVPQQSEQPTPPTPTVIDNVTVTSVVDLQMPPMPSSSIQTRPEQLRRRWTTATMSIENSPLKKKLKIRDYRDRLEVGAAQLHRNPVNADEPSLVIHDVTVNKIPTTQPKPATLTNSTVQQESEQPTPPAVIDDLNLIATSVGQQVPPMPSSPGSSIQPRPDQLRRRKSHYNAFGRVEPLRKKAESKKAFRNFQKIRNLLTKSDVCKFSDYVHINAIEQLLIKLYTTANEHEFEGQHINSDSSGSENQTFIEEQTVQPIEEESVAVHLINTAIKQEAGTPCPIDFKFTPAPININIDSKSLTTTASSTNTELRNHVTTPVPKNARPTRPSIFNTPPTAATTSPIPLVTITSEPQKPPVSAVPQSHQATTSMSQASMGPMIKDEKPSAGTPTSSILQREHSISTSSGLVELDNGTIRIRPGPEMFSSDDEGEEKFEGVYRETFDRLIEMGFISNKKLRKLVKTCKGNLELCIDRCTSI